MKIIITGLLVCFTTFYLFCDVDYNAILTNIDNQERFEDTDISCVGTVLAVKPGEDDIEYKFQQYRRDKKNEVCFIFLSPEMIRGQGLLAIEDNLWFYDSESRKFSHRSFKEDFQNTDAKNSDFKASSYSTDYKVVRTSEEKIASHDALVLELEARNDFVTYPRIRIWVTKDKYLRLKQEMYSVSDKLVVTVYFTHYTKFGDDRYFADKMLFIDNVKQGEKTLVTFTDLRLLKLPDYYFTKAYLEKVGK